jgi:three-Cys-motif partner protein
LIKLESADKTPWRDGFSQVDELPIRESGLWARDKHQHLTYYGKMFATGMKNKFENRVYIELFAGPGRCRFPNGSEDLGSPLQMMNLEFTKFIFIEKNLQGAEALETRIAKHSARAKAIAYCGDCAAAVTKIVVPSARCLALTFVDPTGISHTPFVLIKTLRRRVRTDLLINFPHGMGLKMNQHQYTADEKSILTRFLGTDSWTKFIDKKSADFVRGILDLYKEQLRKLGYLVGTNEVVIRNQQGTPLYMLIFASRDPLGVRFWDDTMKGVQDPQFPFMLK